jgi:hypothetical protein
MHDYYVEGYLTALLAQKTGVRYSPASLAPTALKLAKQYEARALRNPSWLSADTLATLERAATMAGAALATRKTTADIKLRRRALFYAMARRDAFRMVLGYTDPAELALAMGPRVKANPRVPTWRYEHKWRSAKRESLMRAYHELKAEHDAARLELDRARAALSLTLSEKEFDLAGKRKARGLSVRSSRETAQRVRDMRAGVRAARARVRAVQADWRKVRDRKRKLDARIALLEQRIVAAA